MWKYKMSLRLVAYHRLAMLLARSYFFQEHFHQISQLCPFCNFESELELAIRFFLINAFMRFGFCAYPNESALKNVYNVSAYADNFPIRNPHTLCGLGMLG